MKKILALILSLACVFSLASCFGDTPECTQHMDVDGNQYCDICETMFICPDHKDANVDGDCDTCGALYTCPGHADVNGDEVCDNCRAPFVCPGHTDANSNGRCDTCKKEFVCADHKDADANGVCDVCKAAFTCPKHQDNNRDGKCDNCKADYVCVDHMDANADGKCDICGANYTCPGHSDADGDNKCDQCGFNITGKLNPASVAAFIRAYENSIPTKVETSTIRTITGNKDKDDLYTLESHSTLLTGYVGNKVATVYTSTYQELRSVDEGSDNVVESVFKTVNYKKEFLQLRGVRETLDGVAGAWNAGGLNFAPTAGSIAIGIKESNIRNANFEIDGYNHVMTFVVPKANISAVFGTTGVKPNIDATSDVRVTLVSNGATITSVTFTYSVDASGDVARQTVSITTNYYYDVQSITIE